MPYKFVTPVVMVAVYCVGGEVECWRKGQGVACGSKATIPAVTVTTAVPGPNVVVLTVEAIRASLKVASTA